MTDTHHPQPGKQLVGVCGLFCPACYIYIATHEDPEQLEHIAARAQRPAEAVKCNGCRAEKRNHILFPPVCLRTVE